MKKLAMFIAAIFLTAAVQAENILVNANFEKLNKGFPASWFKTGKGKATFQTGKGIVRLEITEAEPMNVSVRQSVFKKVVKGKKYLLTCKVKGDNFKRGKGCDFGLMIVNRSWKGSAGTRRFKVSEDRPITVKKVVTVPENWTDAIVAVFMGNCTGALEFSDIKLTEVK